MLREPKGLIQELVAASEVKVANLDHDDWKQEPLKPQGTSTLNPLGHDPLL
jgi:hypothetical protein